MTRSNSSLTAERQAREHGHHPHRLGRRGAQPAVHAGGASGQGAERRARGPAAMRSSHRSASAAASMNLRARRALVLLVLALPAWAWALDFGFRPPRDPDDVAAVDVMRDLAQRIVPVYQDADTEVFLANVTALQIVSGAHVAAYDSNRALRRLHRGKPFDGLSRARGSRRHLCACARDRSEGAPRLRQGLRALVPGAGAAARQRAGRGRHGAARGSAGVVPGARPAGLRSLARARAASRRPTPWRSCAPGSSTSRVAASACCCPS